MLYLRRTQYNETFNQLLLSFLVVAAAASNSSATLLRRNSGEPARLDPNKYNLRLKKNLLNNMFLSLTTLNARVEKVPELPNPWEQVLMGYLGAFVEKRS